jgi:Cu(I)/Ag(I) efflux system membrane fusion protein
VGRVEAEETRVYRVTAGVHGYVKATYDDTPGTLVKKGQRLAVVYTSELLAPASGYLSTFGGANAATIKQGGTGPQNWPERLHNLGVSDAQLAELRTNRKIPLTIDVVSPADGFILSRTLSPGQTFDRHGEFYRIADLGRIWVDADLFGSEAEAIRRGASARVVLPDQTKSFTARLSKALPRVDTATRTLKLRLEVDNREFLLRPGMSVDVDLLLPSISGLSVPADALLDSGVSQYVFVQHDNHAFERRSVETGLRFGDHVQILKGLTEGEKVVISGTFLVDAESRLRPAGDQRR